MTVGLMCGYGFAMGVVSSSFIAGKVRNWRKASGGIACICEIIPKIDIVCDERILN
jgi:hypothetical protein